MKITDHQQNTEPAPGGTATSKQVVLRYPESDTNYQIIISPLGNAKVWVTNKTTTGFTLNYDIAGGIDVDWVLIRY